MCFVSDPDWYASVCIDETKPATKPVKCDECRKLIAAGEITHHIWMQEHELCRACEDGECECPSRDANDDDAHDCQCEKPQLGETFDYDRCEECDKFLGAVQTAEQESGCGAHESVPSLEMMVSDIQEGGMDEAKKYFIMAKQMYPELVASKYLPKLWRRMFG